MNQDPNKRTVRIVDAKTGDVRLSEPMPVHASRQGGDESRAEPATSEPLPGLTQGATAAPRTDVPASDAPPTNDRKTGPQEQEEEAPAAAREGSGDAAAQVEDSSSGTPTAKTHKPEIETLEQFIEYAYGRKGKPLKLKPKVEKLIAQNSRLDDAALSRLLQVAKGDVLLAVPRQLLLLSRDIDGFPGLRAAFVSFVSNVMLRHPAFQDVGIQAALRNLPEGLSPADALAKVMAFNPAADKDSELLKGDDPATLRRNAAQLFVTWLAVNRGLNADELSSLLFQVIWLPAARDLQDDNARLRALTDIEDDAGVGLACQRFRQQAIEASVQKDQAQRVAADLREGLAAMEARLARAEEQRDALQVELLALRQSSEAELEAVRRQHGVERTHLQHEMEQLRGRLVKRLTDSVDMLVVGLSALGKDSPRVPVMVERAEHVVDALRAEIEKLRED